MNVKIEKRYCVLDSTEYEQSNFVNQTGQKDSILFWLNQLFYSKIFFLEGLAPKHISIFKQDGVTTTPKDTSKYPFLDEDDEKEMSHQDFTIDDFNNYRANDIFFIKQSDDIALLVVAERNRANYNFIKSKAFYIDLKLDDEEILSEAIEEYNITKKVFDKLRTYEEAYWRASKREYALLSAENIRQLATFGNEVHTVDYHENISDWFDPHNERWIVWRACNEVRRKSKDPQQDQSQNDIRIKRLFIIQDDLYNDIEKVKNLIVVIGLQLLIGIEVKLVAKQLYLEWIQTMDSDFKSPFTEIGIDLQNDNNIPDFGYVLETNGESETVKSGVNLTAYPDANDYKSKHGPILENDQKWHKLFSMLFNEDLDISDALHSKPPQEIPQLIIHAKKMIQEIEEKVQEEDGDSILESYISSDLPEYIEKENVYNMIKEEFINIEILRESIEKEQKVFWDHYWQNGTLINSSTNEPLLGLMEEQEIIDNLLSKKRFKRKVNLLEVGCGDGRIIKMLQDNAQANKIKITALDQSEYAIKKINSNFPKIETITEDIFKFERDNTYDVIICADFINHNFKLEELIEKLYSLLKIGGNLALNALTDNRQSINTEIHHNALSIGEDSIVYHVTNNYDGLLLMTKLNQSKIEDLLEKNSFEIKSIEQKPREDEAHEYPFIDEKHEHNFINIIAEKV